MKVVITGAAGLTGRAVATRLAERGHEVIGAVRTPGDARAPDWREFVGDCRDADAMRTVLTGANALVHAAGITLAGPLVEAGLGRIDRVIALSSAGVYSTHRASVNAYRSGEDALVRARPDALVVRPTMIYGSTRDRNVHHVMAFARRFRFIPVIGNGRGLLQPIFFEDLAEAVARLLAGDAVGVVDAGGAEPLTIRQAAKSILSAMGLRTVLVTIPYGAAVVSAGIGERIFSARLAEKVERTREDRTVDNGRLIELTGLHPRSFDAGLVHEAREVLLQDGR